MTHRPLVALLPFLLLATLAGAGRFELRQEKADNSTAAFELRYHAIPSPGGTLPAAAPTAMHALEPELADPGWQPEPPPPPKHSALLAISPGEGGWTLEARGKEPLPSGAFTLREVRVGPLHALQVTAHSGAIPKGEWDIVLSGPAPSDKARADFAPDDDPITRGLFLNGTTPVGRASPPAKEAAALPSPPAPWRISYTEGGHLARVALPGGTALGELRAEHHGRLLSVQPADGAALVYLPVRTNITTDRHDALFLSSDPQDPSPVMAERPAFPSLSPQGVETPQLRRRLYQKRLIYERATPLPIGERFVQYRIGRGQTINSLYPFPDRLTSPTVVARVGVIGLNTTTNVTPDHYAQFSLGGASAGGNLEWKGRIRVEQEFQVELDPSVYPGASGQTISLGHHVPAVPGGPGADLQNLHTVELTWTGYPRLGPDGRLLLQLEEESAAPRLVTVGGFPLGTAPEDVVLLDVTNDAAPIRITSPTLVADHSGTFAVEWEAPETPAVYLVEYQPDPLPALEPVAVPPLPALPPGTLEGIYVCPTPLRDSLQPLLEARGDGYIVLDPQAAYDLYSHGQESPEAIRQALATLVEAAPAAAPFPAIVLVGHATFDYRGYLGFETGAQVPTFIDESIDTSFTIENCIDFPYGLLFGDDSLIDANVSRLPVKTAAELDHVVARLLAHEAVAEDLADLERPAVFAYDNELGILLDRPLFAGLWEQAGRTLHEVVIDPASNGEPERAELIGWLEEDSSAAFVKYSGHGNNTVWSSKSLLRADHIPGIDTNSGYPFVTTFTCLNAYYAFPGAAVRTMAEEWLLAPVGRGAGASFAPSSVDFYNSQRPKIIAFLELLADPERPETTGGLVTRARLAFAIARPDLDLTNREYLLFGDAMTPTTIPADIKAAVEDWGAH